MEHQQNRNNYLINSEARTKMGSSGLGLVNDSMDHSRNYLRKDLSRAFEECYNSAGT
jgi:hypothetical protein